MNHAPGVVPDQPVLRVAEVEHSGVRVQKPARQRKGVRWSRAIKPAAVVLVMVVAAMFGYRALKRPVTIQMSASTTAVVREETRGPGTVQSRFPVSVGSRAAGTLDSVLVDVGQEVQKGQLLATLDRTELEARAQAARRAIDAAQQDVALAEANLDKARSDLELARANHKRNSALVGEGVVSVEIFDQSKAALGAGEANERAARVAIAARKAALARVVQDQRVANTILAYTSITSPMAGIVTRRALEPGSTVAPGVTVFQIVDPNSLWVATHIDQSLSGRIHVGQPATIHLRSGADVSGHVARVTLEADPVTRELEVDVAFDVRPSRFAIHEEADVVILGEETRGVTVPLDAVVRSDEGASVFVVENGRAKRRAVRLGVVGGKRALVAEGLRDGDAVALNPKALRDGQAVVVASGG
jgi:HlyD family secretion protein